LAHVPVLLIHGFPFDHFLWRHQVDALPDRHCLTPDLRGAGANVDYSPDVEFSMAAYANDLVRELDEARVDRAVICGLSMGGYITFELLRRVPERVHAVVLCNTKPEADSPEGKRARVALAARAQQDGARAIAAELLPALVARAPYEGRPEVVREVSDMIARQPVAGIVGALHALRDRPDSTSLLGRIGVPALVIAGEDDQIAPVPVMRQMARGISGARFEIISEAGHVSPLEQPQAVNRLLRDFLAEVG
jgi:pimeloyl-ACP methyl ester carboxylesterase